MRPALALCATLIGISAAAPAWAADPAARAFLESLYRPYRTSDNGPDYASKAKAARYFTPSTTALMAKDMDEAARKGEVGRLDFDPFTGTQDWAPTAIDVEVRDGDRPNRALGLVTYTFQGAAKPTRITLDLVKTPAGWRVSDIHWQDQQASLRQILTRVEE